MTENWGSTGTCLYEWQLTLREKTIIYIDEKQNNYNIMCESLDTCYHKIKQKQCRTSGHGKERYTIKNSFVNLVHKLNTESDDTSTQNRL